MSFQGDLRFGSAALTALDTAAAEISARFALDPGLPTSLDVRLSAEQLVREAVAITGDALDAMGRSPSVALTGTALTHLGGVQRTARSMLDAAAREGIPAADVRADLATLLRGGEVDAVRYGLTRSDLTGLRTVFSDMERLVADQIYDAAHLSEVDRLIDLGDEEADWVRAAGARPCVACDELADGSPYRLDEWPDRPHPWCQCRPKRRRG